MAMRISKPREAFMDTDGTGDIIIDLTQPIPDWPTEHDVRRWLDEGGGGLRDRLCKAWLARRMGELVEPR